MSLAMKIYITTLFLLLSQNNFIFAQNVPYELPDLTNLLAPNKLKAREKWQVKEAKNEFQLAFSSLFFVYKDFFSSQDNAQCNFYPSCSVFAIHSIQKKGIFIGVLSAFDRLSRCNGLNEKDYNRRKDNYLLDDPVF